MSASTSLPSPSTDEKYPSLASAVSVSDHSAVPPVADVKSAYWMVIAPRWKPALIVQSPLMREPQRNLCARDAAEPDQRAETSALEVNIFISVGSFIIVRLVPA